MFGQLCKEYRLEVGVTLREIEGSRDIALLSHFEMGRSSNVAHLAKYLKHAIDHGHKELFYSILEKGIKS